MLRVINVGFRLNLEVLVGAVAYGGALLLFRRQRLGTFRQTLRQLKQVRA